MDYDVDPTSSGYIKFYPGGLSKTIWRRKRGTGSDTIKSPRGHLVSEPRKGSTVNTDNSK